MSLKNGPAGGAKLVSLVARIDSRRPGAKSAQASSSFEDRQPESNEGAAVLALAVQPSDDKAMIECAAQALFEYVFAGTERLDVKHLWMNCDEATKEGFRGEAKAALQAVCHYFSDDGTWEQTTAWRQPKFASS